MNDVRIYSRQTLRRGLDEVFEFFSDARNLGEVTPSWLRFRILTPDIEMRVGATIDYQLRLGPVPLRWTSEITAWEPGRRFTDEQRRGPYRLWIHEHRFSSVGTNTVVEDLVRYQTPGGRIVDACFVRPQLKAIFGYRQRVLGDRFGRGDEDVLRIGHRDDAGSANRPERSGPRGVES